MHYYAVFGHPVRHSRSPWLHAYFARLTQRNISYAAVQPPLDGFATAATAFFARDGRGMNITVPFKAEAFHCADRASAFARRAGVANVLVKRDDKIVAYNTDGGGFLRALADVLPAGVAGKKVLLLGAGGAARAVAFAIAEEKPAALFICNRTKARAVSLAAETNAQAVDDYPPDAEVIINATSAGLAGATFLPPPAVFTKAEVAVDLSYGAAAVPFLQHATACGVRQVLDGAPMLAWQAAMSFAIWEGVMPSVSSAIDYLRIQ